MNGRIHAHWRRRARPLLCAYHQRFASTSAVTLEALSLDRSSRNGESHLVTDFLQDSVQDSAQPAAVHSEKRSPNAPTAPKRATPKILNAHHASIISNRKPWHPPLPWNANTHVASHLPEEPLVDSLKAHETTSLPSKNYLSRLLRLLRTMLPPTTSPKHISAILCLPQFAPLMTEHVFVDLIDWAFTKSNTRVINELSKEMQARGFDMSSPLVLHTYAKGLKKLGCFSAFSKLQRQLLREPQLITPYILNHFRMPHDQGRHRTGHSLDVDPVRDPFNTQSLKLTTSGFFFPANFGALAVEEDGKLIAGSRDDFSEEMLAQFLNAVRLDAGFLLPTLEYLCEHNLYERAHALAHEFLSTVLDLPPDPSRHMHKQTKSPSAAELVNHNTSVNPSKNASLELPFATFYDATCVSAQDLFRAVELCAWVNRILAVLVKYARPADVLALTKSFISTYSTPWFAVRLHRHFILSFLKSLQSSDALALSESGHKSRFLFARDLISTSLSSMPHAPLPCTRAKLDTDVWVLAEMLTLASLDTKVHPSVSDLEGSVSSWLSNIFHRLSRRQQHRLSNSVRWQRSLAQALESGTVTKAALEKPHGTIVRDFPVYDHNHGLWSDISSQRALLRALHSLYACDIEGVLPKVDEEQLEILLQK